MPVIDCCFCIEYFRRPDYCLGPHLRQMLLYGCTRLEIGVQSTYEDVARDTNRGHTVAAVADCFCLAKDAGFKVFLYIALRSGKFCFIAIPFTFRELPS